MAFTTILGIKPAITNSRGSSFTHPNADIVERMGPENNERFCSIKNDEITFPYISKFEKIYEHTENVDGAVFKTGSRNIILKAETEKYSIPRIDSDEVSIEQYFLEHPFKNNIQYIFWKTGDNTSDVSFHADVPGLIYTGTGVVLGYLHSYVANMDGHIILELPYDDYSSYSISGASYEFIGNNLIRFTISNNINVTIKKGNDEATFKLYKYDDYSSHNDQFEIKNVSEYADYIMAARLTDGKITSILNMLTATEFRNTNYSLNGVNGKQYIINTSYYPKYFASLSLYVSSESVTNITPSIFKVPAALVADGDGNKYFMKDVTGVSVNTY